MDDKVRLLRQDSVSADVGALGALVAKVRAVSEDGLLVEVGSSRFSVARMTADVARLSSDDLVGREVLVILEQGDAERPVAVGVLHEAGKTLTESTEAGRSVLSAELDDEELVFDAKNKIRLQCGKASITITRDGKIVLRGTHLLSRSSGPLRIKGGHVEIN